eukprot:ANDGO_04214.mRNA.1 hypothetical protein ACA1_264020
MDPGHRAKFYRLKNAGEWDDRGVGIVRVERGSPELFSFPSDVSHSESSKSAGIMQESHVRREFDDPETKAMKMTAPTSSSRNKSEVAILSVIAEDNPNRTLLKIYLRFPRQEPRNAWYYVQNQSFLMWGAPDYALSFAEGDGCVCVAKQITSSELAHMEDTSSTDFLNDADVENADDGVEFGANNSGMDVERNAFGQNAQGRSEEIDQTGTGAVGLDAIGNGNGNSSGTGNGAAGTVSGSNPTFSSASSGSAALGSNHRKLFAGIPKEIQSPDTIALLVERMKSLCGPTSMPPQRKLAADTLRTNPFVEKMFGCFEKDPELYGSAVFRWLIAALSLQDVHLLSMLLSATYRSHTLALMDYADSVPPYFPPLLSSLSAKTTECSAQNHKEKENESFVAASSPKASNMPLLNFSPSPSSFKDSIAKSNSDHGDANNGAHSPESLCTRSRHLRWFEGKRYIDDIFDYRHHSVSESVRAIAVLGYMRQEALWRVLDDSTMQFIQSFLFLSHVELLQILLKDEVFHSCLKRAVEQQGLRGDVAAFVQELLVLTKSVLDSQEKGRFLNLFFGEKDFIGLWEGMFDLFRQSPWETEEAQRGVDILLAISAMDPNVVLLPVLVEKQHSYWKTLASCLVSPEAPSSFINSLGDLWKRLLECGSDPKLEEGDKNSRYVLFLDSLYSHILVEWCDAVLPPAGETVEDSDSFSGSDSGDAPLVKPALWSESSLERTLVILDILCFCIDNHSNSRVTYFISRECLCSRLDRLLLHPAPKLVQLTALKLIKSLLYKKDAHHDRLLQQSGLLCRVVDILVRQGPSRTHYNLIHSICMDLLIMIASDSSRLMLPRHLSEKCLGEIKSLNDGHLISLYENIGHDKDANGGCDRTAVSVRTEDGATDLPSNTNVNENGGLLGEREINNIDLDDDAAEVSALFDLHRQYGKRDRPDYPSLSIEADAPESLSVASAGDDAKGASSIAKRRRASWGAQMHVPVYEDTM